MLIFLIIVAVIGLYWLGRLGSKTIKMEEETKQQLSRDKVELSKDDLIRQMLSERLSSQGPQQPYYTKHEDVKPQPKAPILQIKGRRIN